MIIRINVAKLIQYFKENWGSPFVLGFMILLMTAAAYLAMGQEAVANDLAVYAYYSLVAGVALQLAAFIRENRGERRQNIGNQKAKNRC